MQFGTLQITELAIAVFVTLVTLVLLYRKLKRLEAEATDTFHIETAVVRYKRYLFEHGHPSIGERLHAKIADIQFDHLIGAEETWARMACPGFTWRRRWNSGPRQVVGFAALSFLGALIGVLIGSRIFDGGDLLGSYIIACAVAVVAVYQVWARELNACSVSISKYGGALLRLDTPLIYERAEKTPPPPSESPRATDDTGMCWTIPRAD